MPNLSAQDVPVVETSLDLKRGEVAFTVSFCTVTMDEPLLTAHIEQLQRYARLLRQHAERKLPRRSLAFTSAAK